MREVRMRFCSALIFAALVGLGASPAHAAKRPGYALGLILGSPTAVTGKMYIDSTRAWDAGLAYDFDDLLTVYGDYLRHWPGTWSGREKFIRELSPYVGIGGLFHNSKDPYRDKDNRRRDESVTNVAVRIPLGIEWIASAVPLGAFVELAPGVVIVPEVDALIMGGIGLRYDFN